MQMVVDVFDRRGVMTVISASLGCERHNIVFKLEDNIVTLATERCADHGHHAPSIEHVHYHLHKVTSEWQHYQRAIARDVQVQCPMDSSGL